MADVAAVHTWVTPAGTIVFNDGSADQYYLNALPGLDGIPARVVIDKVPYGDGGIRHPAWKDSLYFQPQGTLLIQSTRNQQAILQIRNEMENDLREAYESTLNADSTWSWTPYGGSARSVTCRRDATPIEFTHTDNFQVVDFQLALVATTPPSW